MKTLTHTPTTLEDLVAQGWNIDLKAKTTKGGRILFSAFGTHRMHHFLIDETAESMDELIVQLHQRHELATAFSKAVNNGVHVFVGFYHKISDPSKSDDELKEEAESLVLERLNAPHLHPVIDETEVRREDDEVYVCAHVACSVNGFFEKTEDMEAEASKTVNTFIDGDSQVYWTKLIERGLKL